MVERIADLVVIESTKDSVLLPKLSAQLTDIQKRVANLLAKAVTKVTAFLCFHMRANGHRAGRGVSQRLLHKGCQRCQIVIRRMQADRENARDACDFEETNGGRAILRIGAQIALGHHADSRLGKQAGHTR